MYKNLLNIVKDRWQYFVGGYVLGYIACLKVTGIPNIIYLVPFKFIPIIISVIMGTVVYYATESGEYLKSFFKGVKPLIVMLILFFLVMILHRNLKQAYGIDISPFVGL